MIVHTKSWTLTESEFAFVMMSYISCRAQSRLTSTCRRTGHEIPAGSDRVAFAIRTPDGVKTKAGFVCRQCIEAGKQGVSRPEQRGDGRSPVGRS
jgi:hypothetical protein